MYTPNIYFDKLRVVEANSSNTLITPSYTIQTLSITGDLEKDFKIKQALCSYYQKVFDYNAFVVVMTEYAGSEFTRLIRKKAKAWLEEKNEQKEEKVKTELFKDLVVMVQNFLKKWDKTNTISDPI